MSYSFNVQDCEEVMKNYFKNTSGNHIKDTLILTLRNTGSKGWQQYQGYFKCVPEKSNLIFDTVQIPEEAYPNGTIEIVLNFPRIAKNNAHGNCYSTIQLVYKDNPYNEVQINFKKEFDLFGNRLVEEGHVEEEEQKGEINYFKPQEIEKVIVKVDDEEEKEEVDEMSIMIKKFRSCFQLGKLDYPDDYIKTLLEKGKNDFQKAMMIHVDMEDQKKEENKKKVKNTKDLNALVEQFRKEYQLSKDDYSDEVIQKALKKKEGDFNNAFEELMSFIA